MLFRSNAMATSSGTPLVTVLMSRSASSFVNSPGVPTNPTRSGGMIFRTARLRFGVVVAGFLTGFTGFASGTMPIYMGVRHFLRFTWQRPELSVGQPGVSPFRAGVESGATLQNHSGLGKGTSRHGVTTGASSGNSRHLGQVCVVPSLTTAPQP